MYTFCIQCCISRIAVPLAYRIILVGVGGSSVSHSPHDDAYSAAPITLHGFAETAENASFVRSAHRYQTPTMPPVAEDEQTSRCADGLIDDRRRIQQRGNVVGQRGTVRCAQRTANKAYV